MLTKCFDDIEPHFRQLLLYWHWMAGSGQLEGPVPPPAPPPAPSYYLTVGQPVTFLQVEAELLLAGTSTGQVKVDMCNRYTI